MPHLTYSLDDGLATLVLTNPPQNRIDPRMADELDEAVDAIGRSGARADTPWDRLHALYFAGYAMWNYLTAPYLLTRPGVAVEESGPWEDGGVSRRRLRATFPEAIATHAREQTFHYDDVGLLRRHDYAAEVLGSPPAAHFCEKHVTESGLVFPAHRYAVPIDANGAVLPEPVLITIDLAEISVA